ncbi:MAG: glycosyltransferase family 2 protein [Ignavibacteriales bacterium]|nr:glycosyltransferase family 2 protein [Ignavibacteriales bacterium]
MRKCDDRWLSLLWFKSLFSLGMAAKISASTDGTVAAVKKEFPGIEIVCNPTNLRVGGGYNTGLKKAFVDGAPYILMLNNDTIFKPDFLSRLVDAAESSPDVGMVGPKICYYSDPKRIWSAGGRIEWWKGWCYQVGVREVDHGQYDIPGEADWVTGCCVLVKRDVVKVIGLLDESYYLYGEDTDWCVRASRAGFKLWYEPSAVIWHKLSVSIGGHLSWFKNRNKLKSQLRLMVRYAQPYHWLTIPFWIVVNTIISYIRVKQSR